jgi:hypothetical protein
MMREFDRFRWLAVRGPLPKAVQRSSVRGNFALGEVPVDAEILDQCLLGETVTVMQDVADL